MVAVPAEAPVITPADVILATAELLLVQGELEAAVPDPVNVVVDPTQTSAVPEMVGNALMVTVCVAEQPLLFV